MSKPFTSPFSAKAKGGKSVGTAAVINDVSSAQIVNEQKTATAQ